MTKPLSHFELINARSANREKAVDVLFAQLTRDHGVGLDVARKVAASALFGVPDSGYDERGYVRSEAFAKATEVALKEAGVKRASPDAPKPTGAPRIVDVNGVPTYDGRPLTDLSRDELLLLDAREQAAKAAR